MTPNIATDALDQTFDVDATFVGKTQATVTGTTANLVRAWDNTPNTVIVPATDSEGKRFEFVFENVRKDLFDTHSRDRVLEGGLTLSATGYWNKRTWKKTRTTGGWGHTWQFVVAAWTQEDQPFGALPEGMKPASDTDARDAA